MNINFVFDIPNFVIDITTIFQLALSVFIGSLIGRERKRNYKSGGSRTFSLVCLGSTIMALLSIELNKSGFEFDFARIMSYGIVSIGFLGSGIITKNRSQVLGLTSATTLWVLVPIGFLIGLGYYGIALFSAIITYYILESKHKNGRKHSK